MDKRQAVQLAAEVIANADHEIMAKAMLDIAGKVVELTVRRELSMDELFEQAILLCADRILLHEQDDFSQTKASPPIQ